MSLPPRAPCKSVRSEWKYRLSPSGEKVAWDSSPAELIGTPRFTGSDHSAWAKDMASSLGAAGPDSEAHATSNATDSSASAVAANTDLMVTSWLMPAWRARRDGHCREMLIATLWFIPIVAELGDTIGNPTTLPIALADENSEVPEEWKLKLP